MAALTSAVTQMSFGTGRYLEKLKLLDLEEKDDPYEASNHQLRITGQSCRDVAQKGEAVVAVERRAGLPRCTTNEATTDTPTILSVSGSGT